MGSNVTYVQAGPNPDVPVPGEPIVTQPVIPPGATSLTVPLKGGGWAIIPIPTVSQPTFESDYALSAFTAGTYVIMKNAELKAGYTQAVVAYNLMMRSGSFRGNIPVPVAPNSYVYVQGNLDLRVVPSWEQSGPPVTSDIALATVNNATIAPTVRDPFHWHVTVADKGGNGRWFGVGPEDGTPNGFETPVTTSDDGVTGVFLKYGNPFGGKYLRTS